MLTIIIVVFQLIAILLQTIKILQKNINKKPIDGTNFWTFALNAFSLLALIGYQYKYKKSWIFTSYCIIAFVLFYLSTIFIVKARKEEGEEWKIKAGLTGGLVGLAILLTLLTIQSKYYSELLSNTFGFVIGFSFIPYLIHIIKKGNKGTSVPFLALTTISNGIFAYVTYGINTPLFIGMLLLAISKIISMIIITIQSKKYKGDSFIKTEKGMKITLSLTPIIFITIIIVNKLLTKK